MSTVFINTIITIWFFMIPIDINDLSMFKTTMYRTPKQRVGRMHLTLPYTYAEIHEELENEDWIGVAKIHDLGIDVWDKTRLKCVYPSGIRLMHITKYIRSAQFKRQFINFLYDISPNLHLNWDFTQDDMFNHTMLNCEISRDSPNFQTRLHLDFKRIVGTGLIHWSEYDDPNLRTEFYDDLNRSNPLAMTTNFGDGWLHANDYNTWHQGWNRTQLPRYSTLIALVTNIVPIK